MEKHFALTDDEFEKQFINCELNPSNFTHEAHIRLAWICIDKYGIEKAEKYIETNLRKFVEFVGAKDKFNLTLTIAAIKSVNHFKVKSTSDNFKDFINEYPRLKTNFKDLISFHYGFDIYNSKKAKTEFVEPDITPFD